MGAIKQQMIRDADAPSVVGCMTDLIGDLLNDDRPAPVPPSPRLRLYDLPGAFADLAARIAEGDGELPDSLESELDALELALEDKADAIAGLIAEANGEGDYFDAEITRLTARRNAARNRAGRLKAYLHATLTTMGRPAVKGRRFTVRLQRNSAPSIRWTRDMEQLPPEFMRIVVTVDGDKAKAAYKAGVLPPGFSAETGTHLRIV